mmetsp:Transcript_59132/g.168214  ORF Transcript_59132/g.168214 Transcript_59132/m.168214 type:complete len:342 (+) Transcript_59132:1045-2070(+)
MLQNRGERPEHNLLRVPVPLVCEHDIERALAALGHAGECTDNIAEHNRLGLASTGRANCNVLQLPCHAGMIEFGMLVRNEQAREVRDEPHGESYEEGHNERVDRHAVVGGHLEVRDQLRHIDRPLWRAVQHGLPRCLPARVRTAASHRETAVVEGWRGHGLPQLQLEQIAVEAGIDRAGHHVQRAPPTEALAGAQRHFVHVSELHEVPVRIVQQSLHTGGLAALKLSLLNLHNCQRFGLRVGHGIVHRWVVQPLPSAVPHASWADAADVYAGGENVRTRCSVRVQECAVIIGHTSKRDLHTRQAVVVQGMLLQSRRDRRLTARVTRPLGHQRGGSDALFRP